MEKWWSVLREESLTPINIFWVASVGLFTLSVYWLTHHFALPYYPSTAFYSSTLKNGALLFLAFFLCYRACRVMQQRPSGSLLLACFHDIRGFLSWRRLIRALPILILMPLFFSIFTTIKSAIPAFMPFYLDPLLADLDRLLHGGVEPWRLLQPLLGFPLVSMLISGTYKSWFFIKYGLILWQACRLRDTYQRDQFFVALVFCWVGLGVLMAMLMSSAGPCYYGDVYPHLANPFQELMSYLHEADAHYPVFDLFSQGYLWRAYSGEMAVAFSGISAMPSMHLSMAMLFLLSVWPLGRPWRWFFGIYLLLILIGSVHLGWHYALDGYVAIAMTGLLWWLAGKLVNCWHKKGREARPFAGSSECRDTPSC